MGCWSCCAGAQCIMEGSAEGAGQPKTLSLPQSSCPGGACPCVPLHWSKKPAWWGQGLIPLICAVVWASQAWWCFLMGDAQSAGSE